MELTLDQALQKGIEAHKAGKVQEADRLYTAILKANPKHPDANHNMGVLAVGVGKVEAALPFFKSALEVNQTIAQFWLSYIDALIKLNRMDDAKAVFDQSKSNGLQGEGFDQLEQRLDVSKNPDATMIGHSEMNDPPQDQAQQLIDLYSKGQLQEALSQASHLLQEYRSSPVLCYIIGASYRGLGKQEKAIEAYKKAISLKPDYAEAYNNLGNALKDQGDLEEAIEAYTKALSLKPAFAKAYNNLGSGLQAQGNFEEAIEAYNKAILFKSGFAEAYNNMGNALQAVDKLEEAVEAYNKALAVNPDLSDPYYNIGNSLVKQGQLEHAIEAYNNAIRVNPQFANAYNNLGSALQDLGRVREAIIAYEKAIAIKPDLSSVYWNLSGTAQNTKEAKEYLKSCLGVDLAHTEAKLTLAALDYYEGKKVLFHSLERSPISMHPYMRSFAWAFNLENLPPLYFDRWTLFDSMIDLSKKDRPFYEFGVWTGVSFKYLMKSYKKGIGFDTFEGLPEDWHDNKAGIYSSHGNIPNIKGAEFISGMYEDTLPGYFAEVRPKASLINFDADLYSSTLCALNFSKPVIDNYTILVFDEFIMNENWEQDEYRALEEFCAKNNYTYEVLAISFFTKQVAIRLIDV